jgi:hypothetical protein
MVNKAKKSLTSLMATLVLAAPIGRDPKMPEATEPPVTQPARPEPTVLKIYIYEDGGDETLTKSEEPNQQMVDELKRSLGLTDDEDKKFTQLFRDKKFEEAKKYLEELLLEKYNITVEWIVSKKPDISYNPTQDFLYQDFRQVGKNTSDNSSNVILGKSNFVTFKDTQGLLVTRDSSYHPAQDSKVEERLRSIRMQDKAQKWLKTIESARRAKNNGIEP